MYVDVAIWLALFEDSARGERAGDLLAAHSGDLEVSLLTFLELFLVEEAYPFDRERAITAILELAAFDGDPAVLYRASQYRDQGLGTFDAFHAALADAPRDAPDGAGTTDRWLGLADLED